VRKTAGSFQKATEAVGHAFRKPTFASPEERSVDNFS
jgi:hypothetical protein